MISNIQKSLIFLNNGASIYKPTLISQEDVECNQRVYDLFATLCPKYFIGIQKENDNVFVIAMQIIADNFSTHEYSKEFDKNLVRLSKEHYSYFLKKLNEFRINEPKKWDKGLYIHMPVTKTFDSLRLLFSECVGHILNFFIKKEGGLEIINFKTLEDDSEKERKYHYIGDSTAMVETHYGEFLFLDLVDNSVVPTIVKTGWWEPWIDHLINALIEPGMIALDAGANFGYHTNLIAKNIKESGHLYAFEANPHLISYLKRSIWVNGFSPKISLFEAALANEPGDIKFTFYREQAGGGGVCNVGNLETDSIQLFLDHKKIHWGSWNRLFAGKQMMVTMTSIDSALGREVDELNFIHMDIEGSEPLAILGGKKLISRSKNLVMILEWSSNSASETAKEALAFLESLKYKFYMIIPPQGENVYLKPPGLKKITLEQLMVSSHCDIFVSQ